MKITSKKNKKRFWEEPINTWQLEAKGYEVLIILLSIGLSITSILIQIIEII